MKRLLPYPLLTVAILVMWLLLTQSFSPGQVLLGTIVAALAGVSMARLGWLPATIRNWRALLQLAILVAIDVIRSNIAVARIALSPARNRHSAFIRLELALRNPQALAVLALILTATPGTAWVQYNRLDGMLLVHVFDLVDERAWIRLIKTRYERLLLEAFER